MVQCELLWSSLSHDYIPYLRLHLLPDCLGPSGNHLCSYYCTLNDCLVLQTFQDI